MNCLWRLKSTGKSGTGCGFCLYENLPADDRAGRLVPLNVFITPDQKPFYAGTYFPKTSKFNRPGFVDVLEHLSETFANDREHVEDIAENAAKHLQTKTAAKSGEGLLASQRFTGHSSSLPAGLIRSMAVSGRHRNFRCPIC
nr:DUF255 domain-containing protein [Bacillus subtilis]